MSIIQNNCQNNQWNLGRICKMTGKSKSRVVFLSEVYCRKVEDKGRIAFVLEALQQATQEWESHGAGVAIRLHGPKSRTPHHLTLARKAMAVVTDEPFVHPYRAFVDSVQQAVKFAKVPLFSVDGSTTVPPIHKLQKKTRDEKGRLIYMDAPNKAWRWEEKTRPNRRGQVMGTVNDGHLDPPKLKIRLQSNFFVEETGPLSSILPNEWKDATVSAPGKRPWTVEELESIADLKEWVMKWPGIDTSVPPCPQTHGSTKAGMERWANFRDHHLADYAKLRNNITIPHAVSRMSCYLNYGVVSIFDIVNDVWDSKKGKGAAKFIDEVIKWREIGYVHAFARPDYNLGSVVPIWASKWLASERDNNGTSYSLEALANGGTRDAKWNAMQEYLVETGELHNNARMTWGKTMLHWQKHDHSVDDILYQMVYVNDRYALDGLSPPSYAGLLWCFGWCDKPSNKQGAISEKPASRYRVGTDGFEVARQMLMNGPSRTDEEGNLVSPQSSRKQKPGSVSDTKGGAASPSKRQKSIDSYFKAVG